MTSSRVIFTWPQFRNQSTLVRKRCLHMYPGHWDKEGNRLADVTVDQPSPSSTTPLPLSPPAPLPLSHPAPSGAELSSPQPPSVETEPQLPTLDSPDALPSASPAPSGAEANSPPASDETEDGECHFCVEKMTDDEGPHAMVQCFACKKPGCFLVSKDT